MKLKSQESGLGILATIIIIAVIGLGGYTVYKAKVQKNSQLNIHDAQQTEQRRNELKVMVDIKSEILASLAQVDTEISLHSQEGLKASYDLVHRLRLRSLEASTYLSGEPQAELQGFTQLLLDLETSLDTQSQEADYQSIDAQLDASKNASDLLFSSQNTNVDVDAEILEQQHNPDDNEGYVSPEGDGDLKMDTKLNLEGSVSLE